jgi:glycosyltransferase involved in cell wall biosynthesis
MVSVVIPTYAGSRFLGRALDSVFRQSRLPDEVVIVDDASPDDTVTVAETIARNSPVAIRTIRLARNSGGPARPLNVGIDSAHGDVIAVLEQDDVMRPYRIERQLDALASAPDASVIIGRVIRMTANSAGTTPEPPERQFDGIVDLDRDTREIVLLDRDTAFQGLLLVRNFAHSNSNLGFLKGSWQKVGGFNERIRTCSDLEYMFRAAQTGDVAIVNAVVLEYHWRGDSLHRRQPTASSAELTLVRLAAASARPDLAGSRLADLQAETLELIRMALRNGDVLASASLLIRFMRSPSAMTVAAVAARRVCRRRLGRRLR